MKEGWEYKKLGEVANVIHGKNQKDVLSEDGQYPIYGSGGTVMGYATDYLCEAGTTILGRKGSINNPKFIEERFWNVDTAFGITPKDENCSKFIYYFITSIDWLSKNTGTTLPSLTQQVVKDVIIPIPIPSEQQSIVDYLDSAFAKIDAMKANAEKALNEAKALFQASLKEMLEPKEDWEENTLKTICIFSQGIQIPLSNQFENKGEGLTRFLRIIDFTQGNEPPRYVQIVDRKYWLEKDGIAIVRYGASTGYICTGLEGTLANNLFKVTIKDGIKLLSKYLFWWLNSKTFQSEIKKQMNGAAMPAISFGMINDIKINFPSLQEQQSIVATLDSLKSKVDRLQENYDKISQECDALKQAILRQVFE
jgi:type I restriction enzyme S subunit